jgi:hypothetical protein
LFVVGAFAAAMCTIGTWIALVLTCMFISWIRYRKYKQFGHEQDQDETH